MAVGGWDVAMEIILWLFWFAAVQTFTIDQLWRVSEHELIYFE